MYCEYSMTTRQLVESFSKGVPSRVQTEWDAGRLGKYWNVLHVVEPRETYLSYSAKDMPWKSCYYLLDQDGPPLRESGFEENPIGAFLWETTEITDPYGSSCGMDALGVAKAMQHQTKQKAKAIDKIVDPPMVGDPALRNQPSSLISGEITYAGFTPNGSSPKFQPAHELNPQALTAITEDIEEVRDLTRKAMYTDLFLAITLADPRNATVPEIDARKEEQILALGPVLENHFGMMRHVIDRTFYVMQRQGKLPPPPPELDGVDLKVEMVGALAQAFKSIAGNKLERFVGFIGGVAKAQAEAGAQITVLDKVDMDQLVDEMATAIGVPPTVIVGDEDVAKLRAAKAQQQQAAQLAEAAPGLAKGAKDLSETPVNGSTALQEMVDANETEEAA